MAAKHSTSTSATCKSWAKPGVKCVCIAKTNGRWFATNGTGEKLTNGPKARDIFVIKSVSREGYLRFSDQTGAFKADCFRPLVQSSVERDVALFAGLLTKGREAVLA